MLRAAFSRWLPSFEVCRPGWILTTGSLIITTVLWIAARFPGEIPPGFWPWRGLSQVTVLWSVTLMAIAMLAVVRAHAWNRFLAVSIAQFASMSGLSLKN
jgi:hypothetical protein